MTEAKSDSYENDVLSSQSKRYVRSGQVFFHYEYSDRHTEVCCATTDGFVEKYGHYNLQICLPLGEHIIGVMFQELLKMIKEGVVFSPGVEMRTAPFLEWDVCIEKAVWEGERVARLIISNKSPFFNKIYVDLQEGYPSTSGGQSLDSDSVERIWNLAETTSIA